MTERKEAIRETTGGPSPAPELVSSGVHAKGVLESFACDPHCCNSDLTEDPTLIVRNDRNLFPWCPSLSLLRFADTRKKNFARLISLALNPSLSKPTIAFVATLSFNSRFLQFRKYFLFESFPFVVSYLFIQFCNLLTSKTEYIVRYHGNFIH